MGFLFATEPQGAQRPPPDRQNHTQRHPLDPQNDAQDPKNEVLSTPRDVKLNNDDDYDDDEDEDEDEDDDEELFEFPPCFDRAAVEHYGGVSNMACTMTSMASVKTTPSFHGASPPSSAYKSHEPNSMRCLSPMTPLNSFAAARLATWSRSLTLVQCLQTEKVTNVFRQVSCRSR